VQAGRFVPIFWQVTKFTAVGALNVAIDFGILNFLSLVTGVVAGAGVGGLNAVGFIVALSNSYVWNKWWVFEHSGNPKGEELARFFIVNVSALVFVSASLAALTGLGRPWGLTVPEWENAGKAGLTLLAAAGTFSGLKFLVFKKRGAEQ